MGQGSVGWASVAVALLVASCTLTTPLDGFATDGAPASDAGGSGVADVARADAAGFPDVVVSTTTNLHPHGTMENGCSEWFAYRSVREASERAHGGARSCQFCAESDLFVSADDKGEIPRPPLGDYRATAWVRQLEGRPAAVVHLTLRTDSGDQEIEKDSGTDVRVTLEWTQLEVRLRVTKDAESMRVVVASDAGQDPNRCFLVDDVEVTREP